MVQDNIYDIAVIGGGPGGYAAAILAARLKARVVLIEQDKVGGTCLNVGCIPTKALIQSVDAYSHMKDSEMYGFSAQNIEFDIKKAMKFKNQVVSQLTGGVSHILKANQVKVIKGKAIFKDKNCLEVISGDSTQVISARNIIIATGSKEISIPGFEFNGMDIINSTQILSLTDIPGRLVIIGGGVIGVEFASVFRKMGSFVTLVELTPHLIPTEDEEVSDTLKKSLENSGIIVNTDTTAERVVKKSDDSCSLIIRHKDGTNGEITFDKLLVCVGRKAAIEDMGIEVLGLQLHKGRIVTDSGMRTNIDSIYAIGDVTTSEQLAHVAYHEAKVAVLNIMGRNCDADYKAVPRCIFTTPEISCVGLTEKRARELYNIKVARFPFYGNGKALIGGNVEGFIKMIVNKADDSIVGISIIGPKATELIAEPTLAIKKGLTASDLADTIHAHPTLSEVIGEVSLASLGLNLHAM